MNVLQMSLYICIQEKEFGLKPSCSSILVAGPFTAFPWISGLTATPLRDSLSQSLDSIESEMSPHDHTPSEQPSGVADTARARRRLKSDVRDRGS